MSGDKNYPAVNPHGGVQKIFDNVFIVQGSFRMMPGTRISCTMTIVKRGDDLTLINTLRVSAEVEEEIKKLGTIKNVVRICAHHGSCDEYYKDTYEATYYDLPNVDLEGATKTPQADKELPEIPIADAKVLMIKDLKFPEAMILIPDGGGTLITGDFIQNGREAPYKSFLGSAICMVAGFMTGYCNTPPLVFTVYGDNKDMYQPNVPAIMELEFDNIITGHGPAQVGGAKEDLKAGLEKVKEGPLWKANKE